MKTTTQEELKTKIKKFLKQHQGEFFRPSVLAMKFDEKPSEVRKALQELNGIDTWTVAGKAFYGISKTRNRI